MERQAVSSNWILTRNQLLTKVSDIRYFELTPSKIYDYMTSTDDDAVNENDDMDVNSNR